MKILIKIFSAILFLISCASSPSALIPPTLQFNFNSGMIVGTIAIENKRPIFNQYFFHYNSDIDKSISDKQMIVIRPEQLIKMKFKPDFVDSTKAVYFFSINEKPGNFKFTSLRLHQNGGFIQSLREFPIDIDFNIETGKIKYLGEIYFNYNQKIVRLNDKNERDIPKLKEKFPKLKITH